MAIQCPQNGSLEIICVVQNTSYKASLRHRQILILAFIKIACSVSRAPWIFIIARAWLSTCVTCEPQAFTTLQQNSSSLQVSKLVYWIIYTNLFCFWQKPFKAVDYISRHRSAVNLCLLKEQSNRASPSAKPSGHNNRT